MNRLGPICNPCTANPDRPRFHGFPGGAIPAHVWGSTEPSGKPGCQRCGGDILPAALYVCSDDPGRPGVVHVTCPEPSLPSAGGAS